jgi:methyltransferase
MVTQFLFIALLFFLALQRLAELRLSKHNESIILAKGGREHAQEHFPFMQVLHISWFFAAISEVIFLERFFIPWLATVAVLLLVAGQLLRYAAIRTLGPRWSVRIMTQPGSPPVNTGIYRYIRHPNYLGVILEILAVPLLHTAYLTALFFSIANALLLMKRIRAEEAALAQEDQYEKVFINVPRFFPWLRRHHENTTKQP